jgi:hypothetical protein
MVHPLLWPFAAAGGILFKKATMYALAANYGFPRLYRRLLEQNRKLTPKDQQWIVREGLRRALRTPTEAYNVVRDSRVYSFFQKVVQQQSSKLNPVVRTVAETILGSTKIGKNLKELDKFRPKK